MKLYLFNKVMKIHSLLKIPAMTVNEIKVYKNLLLKINLDKILEIFEYGSGYSTLYFAEFLKRKKIRFHLDSIDNNRVWHQTVGKILSRRGLKQCVSLHLSEFNPFWEKEGWDWSVSPACGKFAPQSAEEFEYINKPLSLKKKFDLIVVDARFRRRCLEVARACLKDHGIVFLHDAQKEKYHQPLSEYRYSRFFDSGHYFPFEKIQHRFWVGSQNNNLVEQIK